MKKRSSSNNRGLAWTVVCSLAFALSCHNCSAFSTFPATGSVLTNKQDRHVVARPHPRLTAQPRTPRHSAQSGTQLHYALPAAIPEIVSSLFSSSGQIPLLRSLGLNLALFAILRTKLLKMLTLQGFFHSLFLGTYLWSTLGWKGWTVCVMYLFLGSAVTKVKMAKKEELGIAEGRGGRRGPENVWGSALTGLVCALCSVRAVPPFGISSDLYVLAYVTSLSTKLSDTFASEIGKAYGKTTFLITTFQKVPAGTEGAVSLEGTVAALFGGFLLPLYAYSIGMMTTLWPGVLIAAVSAFLACNCESLIGATVQGKKGFEWVTNEVVNFMNTLIGAGLSLLGGKMFL